MQPEVANLEGGGGGEETAFLRVGFCTTDIHLMCSSLSRRGSSSSAVL